ncbi:MULTISPECIES: hypothetical protein [Kribbella]|uniref:hypothetical protein n=1 Tax=Kribbella TaxID=182639 RepID=UPI001049B966|nr:MULTISPECIES: hypothetical protein [Kribbella]
MSRRYEPIRWSSITSASTGIATRHDVADRLVLGVRDLVEAAPGEVDGRREWCSRMMCWPDERRHFE